MTDRFWPAILAMAAATYLSRSVILALMPTLPLPRFLQRGLRYIPVGVLTALVAPALLAPGGKFALTWQNPDLLAGVVAAAVAVYSRSVLLTMFGGVGAVVLFRWLML